MKKRINISILSLLAFLLGTGLAWTQASRTVARADNAGVWVAWTPANPGFRGTIDVFRQAEGENEWTKASTQPVEFGKYDLNAWLGTDAERKNLQKMADKLHAENGIEGMAKALLLIKAIENPPFARYLGIMYKDEGAIAGTKYRYEVRAASNGSESKFAPSEFVTAGKLVLDPAPAEVRAEALDGGLRFGWNPDTERLTGAHVYMRTGKAGKWNRLNKNIILPSSNTNDKGEEEYPEWIFEQDSIRNGVTYQCMVRGVDYFGMETEESEIFELSPKDLTPPKSVQKLELTVQEKAILVSWAAPKDKERSGFDVYRKDEQDTTWKKINKRPLSPEMTSYRDEIPAKGNVYVYAVAAVDESGNENRCSERFVQVHDIYPPAGVLNLKALADTGRVELNWFANAEEDLKGYLVYRMVRTQGGGDTTLLTASAIDTNYYRDALPKVMKNEMVYFVKAIDTNYNESKLSRPVVAKLPDPVPPDAPFLKNILLDQEALRLVWLPNLESDLAGYKLYRYTKEVAADSLWKELGSRMLSPKDTSYLDSEAEAGTSYYYRLAAFDQAGNRSPLSDAYKGVVNKKKLKAVPQNLELKYNNKKKNIKITWTMPPNQEVAGTMVYRKEGKSAMLPITGLIQETELLDKNVGPGKTYFYEVRAYDKAGNFASSKTLQLNIETK